MKYEFFFTRGKNDSLHANETKKVGGWSYLLREQKTSRLS